MKILKNLFKHKCENNAFHYSEVDKNIIRYCWVCKKCNKKYIVLEI